MTSGVGSVSVVGNSCGPVVAGHIACPCLVPVAAVPDNGAGAKEAEYSHTKVTVVASNVAGLERWRPAAELHMTVPCPPLQPVGEGSPDRRKPGIWPSVARCQAQELVVLDVRLNSTVAEAGEQKKDLTRQKTEVVQLWSEHFARELKALNAKSNNTEIQLEEQGAEVGKLRAMVDNLKKVEVVALWREHYAQARELEVLISRSNNTEIQLQEQESEVVELRGEVDELKKASS
ncbi:uncharacterized protein [Salvelinus alpinus]|uniref:uncharacterized protein n=1 Tax=Salvelinus alpinus TaxID=8036 RepID=UPI0039FDE13D